MNWGNGGQFLQKLHQARLTAPIRAVSGGVLGDEVEFPDPGGGQMLSLGQERGQRPAAVGPPDGGNGAKGAAMAAALGELEVGQVPGGGGKPGLRLGIGEPGGLIGQAGASIVGELFQELGQPGKIVHAHKEVHFGEGRQQFLAVAGHQAAGHHQLFAGIGFLVAGQLQDGVQGLLGGRGDEGAGVDEHHLGLRRRVHHVPPLAGQVAQHDLGVHQVFGTAQADGVEGFGVHSVVQIESAKR